jgi:Flp pilus assembly protein TadB
MISQWLHSCCGQDGWGIALVLVPIILIAVCIILIAVCLLVWYFTRMLQGRKRMF